MWSFNILSVVLAIALPLFYLVDYRVVASGSQMKPDALKIQGDYPVFAMAMFAVIGLCLGGLI